MEGVSKPLWGAGTRSLDYEEENKRCRRESVYWPPGLETYGGFTTFPFLSARAPFFFSSSSWCPGDRKEKLTHHLRIHGLEFT